ncbi:MAG: HAMP domain-containing sensor histidine kinase [Elusimicrobiota bacterium]|jgi:signal transduction histidine kinase
MKLFPKLALMVSSLLIGTTLCLSVAFYFSERRSIEQEAEQERRVVLQNLIHIAQESFLTNDDLLLVKYTGWLQKWNPSLISASVIGTQGEILAHSEPTQIGKTSAPPELSRTEVLVLSEPIRLGNRWIATARAEFSELYFQNLIRARLLQLQKRVSLIAGTAFILALVICFLLALSWTRPISRLAEAAGLIGSGKYQLDLAPMDRRPDELGFLARAFRRMAEQLRELDQMKEDFVSAVTHELRSPLGAIESYLNLIGHEGRQGLDPANWDLYLERLRLNTQRLTRFVNDLLDVAAIERGKITLEPRRTHLAHLAQDVLALFHAKLRDKQLTAEVQAAQETPEAFVDPDKLRQIITNLVSNAIKFTPEKGCFEIRLESEIGQDRLRVSVKDSGIGIALEDQAKIFNKFEQVHSARQNVKGPKGTGLGLSICKALVELHGGTLSVSSQPGEGSVFSFTVPSASSQAEAFKQKSSPPSATVGGLSSPKQPDRSPVSGHGG